MRHRLDAPARINVITGINNTGKTSLLEAIHLLCHQADPREMFDLIRRRLRRDVPPDARHLVELLPHEIQISGSRRRSCAGHGAPIHPHHRARER
ncbi:MAG: AAA family ATPase [bacterium]